MNLKKFILVPSAPGEGEGEKDFHTFKEIRELRGTTGHEGWGKSSNKTEGKGGVEERGSFKKLGPE